MGFEWLMLVWVGFICVYACDVWLVACLAWGCRLFRLPAEQSRHVGCRRTGDNLSVLNLSNVN